jgi:hypothetical protein
MIRGRLGARGAKRRAGTVAQTIQFFSQEIAEIGDISLSETGDSRASAEDFRDFRVVAGLFQNASERGIQDWSGATALHDE